VIWIGAALRGIVESIERGLLRAESNVEIVLKLDDMVGLTGFE
jgi:hypothetical protein